MEQPSPEKLSQLELEARDLAEDRTAQGSARPFFVEFAGSPKSGKSTTIGLVEHFLRRTGFAVLAPAEGASQRTPKYLKDDWVAFNTWSATYALRHVIEGLYHPDQHNVSILDRGLFDALAWFEYLEKKEQITPDEKDRVHRFLTIDHWREAIDMVFLFRTDPVTSLEREHAHTLIEAPGRAMNEDVLKDLDTAYQAVRDQYTSNFLVVDVNTSDDTTPRSTAFEVTRRLLDALGAS